MCSPSAPQNTAIAMTRAGRAVVGGHSPQAMTLPPRRLRAALHPLRHPLELRCARLEPRPALLNMRASVAYSLPRPNSAHAYHFALHARICAHTDIAPCSGSKRARAAVGVPGSESDVAVRATFLRRRATPAFRMLPHATTPRTFLRPTPARACMCSQPMLIWQEQGSHWRWRKLDKLGETHRSRSTRGRAGTAAVGWGGVDGWLGEQGWYPGGPRPAGRSCWVEPAEYRRLVAAGKPTVGSRT